MVTYGQPLGAQIGLAQPTFDPNMLNKGDGLDDIRQMATQMLMQQQQGESNPRPPTPDELGDIRKAAMEKLTGRVNVPGQGAAGSQSTPPEQDVDPAGQLLEGTKAELRDQDESAHHQTMVPKALRSLMNAGNGSLADVLAQQGKTQFQPQETSTTAAPTQAQPSQLPSQQQQQPEFNFIGDPFYQEQLNAQQQLGPHATDRIVTDAGGAAGTDMYARDAIAKVLDQYNGGSAFVPGRRAIAAADLKTIYQGGPKAVAETVGRIMRQQEGMGGYDENDRRNLGALLQIVSAEGAGSRPAVQAPAQRGVTPPPPSNLPKGTSPEDVTKQPTEDAVSPPTEGGTIGGLALGGIAQKAQDVANQLFNSGIDTLDKAKAALKAQVPEYKDLLDDPKYQDMLKKYEDQYTAAQAQTDRKPSVLQYIGAVLLAVLGAHPDTIQRVLHPTYGQDLQREQMAGHTLMQARLHGLADRERLLQEQMRDRTMLQRYGINPDQQGGANPTQGGILGVANSRLGLQQHAQQWKEDQARLKENIDASTKLFENFLHASSQATSPMQRDYFQQRAIDMLKDVNAARQASGLNPLPPSILVAPPKPKPVGMGAPQQNAGQGGVSEGAARLLGLNA